MKRLALGLAMAMALVGCSSDDSPSNTADASVSDGASIDPCDYWTTSGDICPIATGRVCFPECTSGGCRCRRQADGQLRWSCVTDTSCLPDSGPLDDTGAPDVVMDVSAPDAGDDASDASGDVNTGDADDAG